MVSNEKLHNFVIQLHNIQISNQFKEMNQKNLFYIFRAPCNVVIGVVASLNLSISSLASLDAFCD